MHETTKAQVELRKDMADLLVRMLEHKATVVALRETLFSLDHSARGCFEKHLEIAEAQTAEEKKEWIEIADGLKSMLDKPAIQMGPIH